MNASRDDVCCALFALAIVIACLGLFGLAAFTADRRTKEIGIRKVFGARTGNLVLLLLWQFSIPVFLANLLAWPVASGIISAVGCRASQTASRSILCISSPPDWLR